MIILFTYLNYYQLLLLQTIFFKLFSLAAISFYSQIPLVLFQQMSIFKKYYSNICEPANSYVSVVATVL